MAATKYISFDEIVQGRDSQVRVTDDGLIYAVDLVMVVTGKDRDHASQALRGLSNDVFSVERFVQRKFPGKGNAHTKLLTFQHAIELVMVLPGKSAKKNRTKFAVVLTRYMAGDKSLVGDIETNASSTSPIAQMARDSLEDNSRKRKIEDLEVEERRIKIQELASMNQLRMAEAHKREAEVQRLLMDNYLSLCPNNTMDDRARLVFKDYCLSLALRGIGGPVINKNSDDNPVTISNLAANIGLKFSTSELISIGQEVKKRYKAKYGADPSKHEQQCGGAVRAVCSYTEKDADMIQQVLREFAAKK